jgi:FkbM family methyltransferase
MESYYSQHGEDFLVNKIFNNKTNGVFVEIGCLDGIEYSNTYYFEKKGWSGVCVEAHNDFITSLKTNRPGSTIVHCAVGEENKDEVVFYANKIGSLSTLDKSEEKRWQENYKDYFHGFEEQKVRMRTMTSIFDELKIGQIDFVSLDIEGYEINALKGLDFNKYKPSIFVIEYKDEEHKKGLEAILFPAGYKYLATIGCNLFYGLNYSAKKIINTNYGTINLTHVDMEGQARSHEVVLSKPTLKARVKNVVRKIIRP